MNCSSISTAKACNERLLDGGVRRENRKKNKESEMRNEKVNRTFSFPFGH
jgi:hypothetical protein